MKKKFIFVRRIIKKIIYKEKVDTETYINYLRKIGVTIGNNVEIFFLRDTTIDITNPFLLEIGSNVSMTGPVCILCHDYSVCVTKKKYNGYILGKQKKTIIGDNVFLGWGACVLPGSHIHENTIIGAYSVVSGSLEPNSVYAGNPAKRISSIDDFYKRRFDSQLKEAVEIYKSYVKIYNKKPDEKIFHEYFFLFSSEKNGTLNSLFEKKMYDHGNYEESLLAWKNNNPLFNSFEDFCVYCEKS